MNLNERMKYAYWECSLRFRNNNRSYENFAMDVIKNNDDIYSIEDSIVRLESVGNNPIELLDYLQMVLAVTKYRDISNLLIKNNTYKICSDVVFDNKVLQDMTIKNGVVYEHISEVHSTILAIVYQYNTASNVLDRKIYTWLSENGYI